MADACKSTSSSKKRKQKAISISTKMELIKLVEESHRSKTDICKELGIPTSTLGTILKKKNEIRAMYERSQYVRDRKRMKKVKHEDLEVELLRWFKQADVPATGPVLMEKATEIAGRMGIEFSANPGWLDRFKRRNGLSYRNVGADLMVDVIKEDCDPPRQKSLASASSTSTGAPSPLGRLSASSLPPLLPKILPKAVPSSATSVSAPSSSTAPSTSSSSAIKTAAQEKSQSETSDGEVCLRWNSHHSNMQTSFPSLLDSEQYVDVTLAAEGKVLKCHRLILSSCSTYFDEILKGISFPQHPVIFLRDIPFWVIKALVDFMYKGEVNIDQSKLPDLLSAAEVLQVKGLAGKVNHNTEETIKTPKEFASPTKTLHYQQKTVDRSHDDQIITNRVEAMVAQFTPRTKGRKRKSVAEAPVEEEMPMLRRGTKSRPNVKQPKYYDNDYDESSPVDEPYSPEDSQPLNTIKVEPIDVYESDLTFNLPIDTEIQDPFHDVNEGEKDASISNENSTIDPGEDEDDGEDYGNDDDEDASQHGSNQGDRNVEGGDDESSRLAKESKKITDGAPPE